ncbi:YesL family protein [Bacillus sp. FSL K6-3431]|uniref:YesL family protein n=1 Tax=Bacillus sp. FSL K6-3431 TaxID=2921500 RepID=UPI0030F7D72D
MINTRGLAGVFFGVSEWIFRVMYVHILWVVFTILGLGIFGFMPATSAVFSVIRKWLMKEDDISIFPYFYQTYKSSWKSSNLIGLVMLIIGGFLYIDIKVSQEFLKFAPLHICLLIISFVFFLTCLYLFPVFSHYKLKPLQYIKQSFLLAFSQPLYTISMLLWVSCAYIIYIKIPVVYFFMGASILSYPIMWFSLMSFNKLAKKQIQ